MKYKYERIQSALRLKNRISQRNSSIVTKWKADNTNLIESLLESKLKLLTANSVVAVIVDKKQPIENANYKRLERFKVGKRQVVFLEPRLS